MITICKNCKHKLFKGKMWYEQYCKVNKRSKGINPVSGEKQYVAINSLNQKYYTDTPYGYCRDFNDGNCKSYTN